MSRRRFLGGAAAAIGLPFFESLAPRAARAAASPRRLLFYFVPCGMRMDAWTPRQTGDLARLATLPRLLQPVGRHLDAISIISGLDQLRVATYEAGDHARGTAGFLTCVLPKMSPIAVGTSVDQIAAKAIGAASRYPSLQVGTVTRAPYRDDPYPEVFLDTISWAGPTANLPNISDPATLFDRLFAGFDPAATEADRIGRLRRRTSVLDHAQADATRLRATLGQADRVKLDAYITGIRELEVRIQASALPSACAAPARPASSITGNFPLHVRVLTDLVVLALQCDATRVVTFMQDMGASARSFGFLGSDTAEGHHALSHHQSLPAKLAAWEKIDHWEMTQFAYLLDRMRAVDEGGGTTLLDNAAVFLSSEVADGDRHYHDNLPVLLAGRGGGALHPGRHIAYPGRPIADLFLAMLRTVGVEQSSFGDGRSALTEL